MHYLLCGHCARHSALTEYITFCDHCGKKLPVTFAGWKVQHPGGDLARFAAEAGVTQQQYQAAARPKKGWGAYLRPKAALITTAVVLAACSALGAWYGPGLVSLFHQPVVPAVWLETANWRTFRGNILRLQTPLSLAPAEGKNVPNMRVKTFRGSSSQAGLDVALQEAVYLAANHLDLQTAARAAADDLARQAGVSQFSYTEKKAQLNGLPAVWQEGSYVQDHASPVGFRSLVMVKGGTRVQLLVTHPGNDSTGRRVAEAILQSVQLN